MVNSLMDILRLIDVYSAHLVRRGAIFDSSGFPLLEKEAFLTEWPNMIVPYRHRTAPFVADKSRTVLCHYCDDRHIYPRLENVIDDLPTYREFMGVIGADITVTPDIDVEWQAATMLLNHLYTAMLAMHGVKVIANLRCGSEETLKYLSCIPHGVMCASGFLGCNKTQSTLDYVYATKILTVMPSKLLLYGKHDTIEERHLDTLGIDYRCYTDVRRRYFMSTP